MIKWWLSKNKYQWKNNIIEKYKEIYIQEIQSDKNHFEKENHIQSWIRGIWIHFYENHECIKKLKNQIFFHQ